MKSLCPIERRRLMENLGEDSSACEVGDLFLTFTFSTHELFRISWVQDFEFSYLVYKV